MTLLMKLLGPYGFQGFSLILTFVESTFCISLFARKLDKRRLFALRLTIGWVAGILICYGLAVWYTNTDTLLVRVLCYSAISVLTFGFLALCWRDTMQELLLAFCSGTAAYQFTNKLYPLLQNLLGINDRETVSLLHGGTENIQQWDYLLFFVFHVACFFLLAHFFTPKGRLQHNRRTTRNVIVISMSTVALVNVLICISRVYEAESPVLNLVMKVLYVAFSLVILLACAGLFSESEKEQQLATIQQLWRQDKAQFESIKANMDVINLKCHDLKHILVRIEDKLTQEEAGSLREAIEFYDSNIRTGNEVLDVVLCEKAMTCQKRGISFSCMADGARLDFLSPVQIYSLFGNIIDNAMEAVLRLPSGDDRVIALTVHEEGDALVIEESNYFTGELEIKDGIPTTGKQDASRHGYGTQSIRYIAQQYGGTMDIKVVNNMFFLTITFPLKAV